MTEDERVEAELRRDRAIYGNSFWRLIDGHKVRIPPECVRFDRMGRPYVMMGILGPPTRVDVESGSGPAS